MMLESAYASYCDTVRDENWIAIQETTSDVPWYISFGRDIRSRMLEVPMPECPADITCVEDLCDRAKELANRQWGMAMLKHIWSSPREDVPPISEYWLTLARAYDPIDPEEAERMSEFTRVLEDPLSVADLFTYEGMHLFESLKLVDSESWSAMVATYAEREMASLHVLRDWTFSMPEHVYTAVSKQMNRDELLLITELGSLTKYPNVALLKLLDLMQTPAGMSKTDYPGDSGVQYLLECVDDENPTSVRFVPFSDVYRLEWEALSFHMNRMSTRIATLVQSDTIPKSYGILSVFLSKLAYAYSLPSVTPARVDAVWKDVETWEGMLLDSDCPIVVHPMGCPSVTGEANKMDPEISVSLHLARERNLEHDMKPYHAQAARIQERFLKHGQVTLGIPNVYVVYHIASGGTNIYWQIEGVSGENVIISHHNRIEQKFHKSYLPIIRALYGRDLALDEIEEFLCFFIVATGGHELGHTIVNVDDPKIKARIGSHATAYSMDEVKADSSFARLLKTRQVSAKKAQQYMFAYMAWCIHYLQMHSPEDSNSGQQYYVLGLVELATIAVAGKVTIADDHVTIADPKRALRTLSGISDRLRNVYLDPNTRPSDVRRIMKELISEAKGVELVKKLVKFCRNGGT